MCPGADCGADDGVMGIGIPLTGEGFDVAVTTLIDVVDHPSFLRLPGRTLPGPLAYRHRRLLF
jgi:hypothetical protein